MAVASSVQINAEDHKIPNASLTGVAQAFWGVVATETSFFCTAPYDMSAKQ